MSTDGELRVNPTPRPSPRERLQVALFLASMLGVVVLATIAGGYAGYAITGKPSSAVAGGGIALVAVVVVVQRFVLHESAIEIGCIAVALVVCLAMLYYTTRMAEQR